jgi:hypothetical protein
MFARPKQVSIRAKAEFVIVFLLVIELVKYDYDSITSRITRKAGLPSQPGL